MKNIGIGGHAEIQLFYEEVLIYEVASEIRVIYIIVFLEIVYHKDLHEMDVWIDL